LNLHQLYHDASAIRSANQTIRAAEAAKKEFNAKDKKRAFFDKAEREKAAERVYAIEEKVEEARRVIEKIKSKLSNEENVTASLAVVIGAHEKQTPIRISRSFEPEQRAGGYTKDAFRKSVKDVLNIVHDVLNEKLPEEEAAPILAEVIKRVRRK
jgi:hypothetical protein